MTETEKKKHDITAAMQKARAWCAYQERSHQEVREKLYVDGLPSHIVESMMASLISEGFVNEQRFANAFAGGKFRIKKWGRNKIIHGLRRHGISERCISRALNEIDEDDYRQCIRIIILDKMKSLRTGTFRERIAKTIRFLTSRGFETELIYEIANKLKPK